MRDYAPPVNSSELLVFNGEIKYINDLHVKSMRTLSMNMIALQKKYKLRVLITNITKGILKIYITELKLFIFIAA